MIIPGKKYRLKTKDEIEKTYANGLRGVPWGLNDTMINLFGKEVTVHSVRKVFGTIKGCIGQKVFIEEDHLRWKYHSDLFVQNDRTDLVHKEIKRLLT